MTIRTCGSHCTPVGRIHHGSWTAPTGSRTRLCQPTSRPRSTRTRLRSPTSRR
ncbi:hypothetical protein ACFPRL_21500 [Pseudoclavibacter helvolus]